MENTAIGIIIYTGIAFDNNIAITTTSANAPYFKFLDANIANIAPKIADETYLKAVKTTGGKMLIRAAPPIAAIVTIIVFVKIEPAIPSVAISSAFFVPGSTPKLS